MLSKGSKGSLISRSRIWKSEQVIHVSDDKYLSLVQVMCCTGNHESVMKTLFEEFFSHCYLQDYIPGQQQKSK